MCRPDTYVAYQVDPAVLFNQVEGWPDRQRQGRRCRRRPAGRRAVRDRLQSLEDDEFIIVVSPDGRKIGMLPSGGQYDLIGYLVVKEQK